MFSFSYYLPYLFPLSLPSIPHLLRSPTPLPSASKFRVEKKKKQRKFDFFICLNRRKFKQSEAGFKGIHGILGIQRYRGIQRIQGIQVIQEIQGDTEDTELYR